MASTYTTRVFADGNDTCLVTSTSMDWIRQLSIGNNWTRIRLGVLAAITPNGINNIAGRIWLGMNSGTSNPVNSATCANWIGARFTNANQWNYLAGAGNPYYQQAIAGYTVVAATKRNAVVTTTAGWGPQVPYLASNTGATQRRSIFIVEITKGAPNYTIRGYLMQSTRMAYDFTKVSFFDYGPTWLTGASNFGWRLAAFQVTNLDTIACDELAGDLNSVNVYVSIGTSMDIYGIFAHKVY